MSNGKQSTRKDYEEKYPLLTRAGLINQVLRESNMKYGYTSSKKSYFERELEKYDKYNKFLINYYLDKINGTDSKIPYLYPEMVLKILDEDFPEDNLSIRKVKLFLGQYFEKDGKNSFIVPKGHPINS